MPILSPHTHPRRDDQGRAVLIENPSIASPLEQWLDPSAIAVAVPDGPLVETLNGIPLSRQPSSAPWPGDVWREEACCFDEPPFEPPAGLAPAAGVVTLEPDGRVWLVAPTNGYGGYKLTFPKGKLDAGRDRRTWAKDLHQQVHALWVGLGASPLGTETASHTAPPVKPWA